MNAGQLFFGFTGRINRAKFWLAALIYVVFFVVGMLIVVAATSSPGVRLNAAFVLYIPIVISAIAVGIRRLHDRNKSGWWLLLFYAGPILLQSFGHYLPIMTGGTDGALVSQILVLAGFAINIWMVVELGCLRGSIGPNPYGPDPIATALATPQIAR